jgi:hypothetical protein
MEGSRAMMGCLVRQMDITEVYWPKLWCSVCTTVVIERSRAMLG